MPLFKLGPLGLISLSLICGAALTGCGPTGGEPLQQRAQRISGGEQGDAWSAVFGTFMHEEDGIAGCSATLIAKNLLLTARHCVSLTSSRRVICGKSTLGEPVSGDALIAANSPDLARSSRSDWFRGSEVYVPEEGNDSCGFDVALIILSQNVPDSVARPAIPRIDREVSAGERYVAVGYGLDELGGSGERRQRRDLVVQCEPGTCGAGVRSSEFVGEAGACEGDSGGPALDADGKVVGVVSRSGDACEEPVYGTVTAWRDLIIRVAKRAATLGGYEPPSWVRTGSSEGASVVPPCEGCGGRGPEDGAGGRGTLPSGEGGSTATGSSASLGGAAAASGGRVSMAGAQTTSPVAGASDGEPTPGENLEASCNMGHARSTPTRGMGVLLSVVGLAALRRRRRRGLGKRV